MCTKLLKTCLLSVLWIAGPLNSIQAGQIEESLIFEIGKHPVDHQGPQVIDLIVELTYVPEIGPKDYPDFEVVRAQLIKWMEAYPNEADYWEVFNREMGKYVLATWPMVSRAQLDIVVYPTFSIQYAHTSRCIVIR